MPGAAGPQQQAITLPDTPTVMQDAHKKEAKPLKKYRYTIINGVGKKESGTFDAENDNDVRNFLLSLNYHYYLLKLQILIPL